MSDFVNEEIIEIEVLGRKFSFKEMNGSEHDKMLSESIRIVEGVPQMDLVVRNKHYLAKVVKTPYPDFESCKDKIGFLNKLKANIRGGLLKKIKNFHNELGETEKK